MFCPYCANLLLVEAAPEGMHFACKVDVDGFVVVDNCPPIDLFFVWAASQTCPYDYKIAKKLKKDIPLQQKKVRAEMLSFLSRRYSLG